MPALPVREKAPIMEEAGVGPMGGKTKEGAGAKLFVDEGFSTMKGMF